MDYGFLFHFDLQDYTKDDIESFFLRFNTKINAYRQQFSKTVALYEKSYNDAIKENEEHYQKAIAVADVAYAKFWDEMSGSDDLRHQYAAHFSGISQIEDKHRDFQEPLMDLYSEMKNNYFKSAVIQLYSLLESTLNGTCNMLQKRANLAAGVDSLKEMDYQLRAKNYLRKKVGLNMADIKQHNPHLISIQNLRNTLVHSLDAIAPKKVATITKIVDKANGELNLMHHGSESSVHITGPTYLYSCYDKIALYFHDLFWLIEEKFDYPVNRKRVANLFSYVDPGISIKKIKAGPHTDLDTSAPSKKILVTAAINRNDVKLLFNLEISYSTSDEDGTEITTAPDLLSDQGIKRLHDILSKQSYTILGDMFTVFFLAGKPKSLKVKIY